MITQMAKEKLIPSNFKYFSIFFFQHRVLQPNQIKHVSRISTFSEHVLFPKKVMIH